ncbi:MAG: DbpA RNA binding domain-containing protein, partial [Gammaproteobacteria bacterium]|nr:DbpA RNA binding domain-containing protein [Gammaproteobacteria bacterium]
AKMLQGDTPLLLQNKPQKNVKENWDRQDSSSRKRPERGVRDRGPRQERSDRSARKDAPVEDGMDRYRIEVGHNHDVMPGNIVGAIANEVDIDSKFIGRINIHDEYSLVDLPAKIPSEMLEDLKKVWVAGQQLRISLFDKNKDSWKDNKEKSETRDTGKGKPKDKSKSKSKLSIKNSSKKKVRKDKDKGKRKP